LDSKHSHGWVRARAASEALKREGYRHAAEAAPYDDPATRDGLLRAEVQKIEAEVDDLIGLRAPKGRSGIPLTAISPQEYMHRRVSTQINEFFEPKANQSQAAARKMRRIEFMLAIATTVITAVMSVLEKHTFG